jgi:hypothetical protein
LAAASRESEKSSPILSFWNARRITSNGVLYAKLDLLLQADETIAAALDEEGEFSELNEETILAIPVVTWTSPKYPHLRPGIYVCFHLSCCLVLIREYLQGSIKTRMRSFQRWEKS